MVAGAVSQGAQWPVDIHGAEIHGAVVGHQVLTEKTLRVVAALPLV